MKFDIRELHLYPVGTLLSSAECSAEFKETYTGRGNRRPIFFFNPDFLRTWPMEMSLRFHLGVNSLMAYTS